MTKLVFLAALTAWLLYLHNLILCRIRFEYFKWVVCILLYHHGLVSRFRSIVERYRSRVWAREYNLLLLACHRSVSLLVYGKRATGGWKFAVSIFTVLVNSEESIDLSIACYRLSLQLKCLIHLAFANKWAHINLNWTSYLFASNWRVNQLNVAVFSLIATFTVLIESALPWETEVKLVSVPIPIHLKRLADILLGPARPSKFEYQGLINIDLKGWNL